MVGYVVPNNSGGRAADSQINCHKQFWRRPWGLWHPAQGKAADCAGVQTGLTVRSACRVSPRRRPEEMPEGFDAARHFWASKSALGEQHQSPGEDVIPGRIILRPLQSSRPAGSGAYNLDPKGRPCTLSMRSGSHARPHMPCDPHTRLHCCLYARLSNWPLTILSACSRGADGRSPSTLCRHKL